MPEVKFSEEGVLDSALELIRKHGYRTLSARSIAKAAGCSVQPLYSRFGGMDGLMRALYEHARKWVIEYNKKNAGEACNSFASNGRSHIRLAQEERNLFEFLYLSPYMPADSIDVLFESVSQPGVLEGIAKRGGVDKGRARELYVNMIVYTHGLASMIACGASFSDDELEPLMDNAFYAFAAAAGIAQPENDR
ncbi:MAG: TetR/AcrR family transcriptional regulator [Coriobacteriales bacterium]|jgi:AcrR family transcriptional regulator